MFQVHRIVANVDILIENVKLHITDILSVNRICRDVDQKRPKYNVILF